MKKSNIIKVNDTSKVVEGSVEIIRKKTPKGGDYSVIIYTDKAGEPVPKNKAEMIEIIELTDDNKEVGRTYLKRKRDK